MKTRQAVVETLSQYLLLKAEAFSYYPKRDYAQTPDRKKLVTNLYRLLLDWRRTFQPIPMDPAVDFFHQAVMLDQLYTRDLLTRVPAMVERTRQLRTLTFAGISDPQALTYLRESASCYIYGLFQGAVALARSAMERQLRSRAAGFLGAQAAEQAELKELIDRCAGRLFKQSVSAAHSLRKAANDVLHQATTDQATALRALESARSVVLELTPPR